MPPERPPKTVDSLKADIATIDSKIGLIASKIRTLETNQEILGQTVVAQNEKMRLLEERGGGSIGLNESAEKKAEDASALRAEIEDLRKQIQEMRYVLNSVNPLEFVTVDQVREMLKDKEAPKA